jgi:hypothetical protein
MSSDQVREAFEHWFSDGGEHPLACQRAADGGYLLAQAESSWTAWQAATASHAADVEAIRDALRRIALAKPDRLDHSRDVAIIERAARIAAAALKGD